MLCTISTVTTTYPGPAREEPLAVQLHNTLNASGGALVDGLAEPASARAWLTAVGDRLPDGGGGAAPGAAALAALRGPLREALTALVEGRRPPRAALAALNEASARAPASPAARWRAGGPPLAEVDRHGASRAEVVLGAIAADAIDLLTGPRGRELRACGAPGCVLLFLRDHPRREWCSPACGNRARQARHYRRSRGRP